jgi:hypothetical protein
VASKDARHAEREPRARSELPSKAAVESAIHGGSADIYPARVVFMQKICGCIVDAMPHDESFAQRRVSLPQDLHATDRQSWRIYFHRYANADNRLDVYISWNGLV